MRRALALARLAAYSVSPNPSVGCVLTRADAIVGEGWTQPPGGAHAEIKALSTCTDPRGTTAYVTLEPCAHTGRTGPCCEALIEAGVARVVAAIEDPFEAVRGRGLARLREAGVDVQLGLLADEARRHHAGFLTRVATGRPFVRVKIAASLDGATALSNGESKWITGEAARRDVHWLRAASDAVVTGVGTVIADNPMLTARLDQSHTEPLRVTQPRAVLLDSDFSSPPQSNLLQRDSLVFTAPDTDVPAGAFEQAALPRAGRGLDLGALLDELGRRQHNEVLVEAGPRLTGAFIEARLLDELIVYQAPRLMGAGARTMANIGPFSSMDDVIQLTPVASERVGDCTKMTFTRSD